MDENKLMNGRKTPKAKKAYYAIVGTVLTACVATGVYAWTNYKHAAEKYAYNKEESRGLGDYTAYDVTDEPAVAYESPVALEVSSEPDMSVSGNLEADATGKPSGKARSVAAEASFPEFIAPVSGKISLEYSMDAPVFCETLQEWRTHSGIDIAAELGEAVKCAANGVVKYVKSDPRYGKTVIIDHDGGVNTVYANLSEDVAVRSGQQMNAGDVIGYVGNSSYFESLDTPHLHLEVMADEQPVDPTGLIPREKKKKQG